MSNKSKKVPLKRNFISLESKIQILDRLKKGEKVSYVARSLNLNEATIRTIRKNEQKIRTAIAIGSSISANMTARPRAPIIQKMEKVLGIWIDYCCKRQIPLEGNVIKQKALEIYNHLKENGESSVTPEFVASKGWFTRFKNRFSLQTLRIQGESILADNEAARKYPEQFQKIIKDHGYTSHQVFNASEASLWWKKMPNRTFISRIEKTESRFTASKDCVTLLMCSNASGDYMLKPMLVYRSSNPHAMKDVNKNTLPVYWKANKNAWVTASLFKEWFLNCFVPSVENYLKWKNLDFKVLLLLDNSPSHPKDLNHPNVKVIFLPPNITSLIQPLDQGIISTFKTHYFKKLLQWILEKVNSEYIEVMEAWKHFSIADCIGIIALSLKEVMPSTLNRCWKNVWPESVQSRNMIELSENGISEIVEIAKSVRGEGFDDMTIEDIQELLIEKDIDKMDPVEMALGINQIDSEDDSTDENSELQNFTLKSIQEGINLGKKLELYFLNADPSIERSTKFKRELEKCLAPYYEIYKDLSSKNEQIEIIDILDDVDITENPNVAEESSENEDILQQRKPSYLRLAAMKKRKIK